MKKSFHEKILEQPNSFQARLEFADWLSERDDPRGELIRIHHKLLQVDVANRRALEARMHTLLQAGVQPVAVTVKNSIGISLALIPPGEFLMGSPESDRHAVADEKPQRRVRISRAFFCGVFPVTGQQYEQATGKDPSVFKGAQLPVDGVNWFDAVRFCNYLSQLEGLYVFYKIDGERVDIVQGTGYRLPTEAEWEYACRAGTSTKYFFGDDKARLKDYAVYLPNSLASFLPRSTRPCGSKLPNPFGLYDMHGNVWEWCNDWYAKYSAPDACNVDPVGPEQGFERVVRGGSFFELPAGVRSANRLFSEPDFPFCGFRVVRTCD